MLVPGSKEKEKTLVGGEGGTAIDRLRYEFFSWKTWKQRRYCF